jgi:hypothetical protein
MNRPLKPLRRPHHEEKANSARATWVLKCIAIIPLIVGTVVAGKKDRFDLDLDLDLDTARS